jgi:hypothetical protein
MLEKKSQGRSEYFVDILVLRLFLRPEPVSLGVYAPGLNQPTSQVVVLTLESYRVLLHFNQFLVLLAQGLYPEVQFVHNASVGFIFASSSLDDDRPLQLFDLS